MWSWRVHLLRQGYSSFDIKDKYEKGALEKCCFWVFYSGLYTAAVVYALGSFLEERFPHEENTVLHGFFQLGGGGGGCEVSVSVFSHLGQPQLQ